MSSQDRDTQPCCRIGSRILMLEKLHTPSLSSLPPLQRPKSILQPSGFQMEHMSKNTSRGNLSEASYGDAFSGHLRQMNISIFGV